MKVITIDIVHYVAHELAIKLFSLKEPIPPFEDVIISKLESSINQPFQEVYGEELYKGLVNKSAILFYLIIKNHPFSNGNKRIAVCILLVFLFRNDKWLNTNSEDLYKIAVYVAESKSEDKDSVLKTLHEYISKYIIDSD